MELIVSRPSGARVVKDYLADEGTATAFYGRRFDRPESYASKAEEVDGRFDRAARERVLESLIVPEGADEARLTAFVEEGGYVVTTGQQPGLFGGPLYSIHKAVTAIRLAETLEAQLGKPVLPVFWVASDDHDWAEANHADLIGIDNELHRYEIASPTPTLSPPLHRIELGEDADRVVADFVAQLPDSDFSRPFIDVMRSGFASGSTMPAGFHALLQKVLGSYGLFFTDAAHAGVKAASTELLLSELGRAEELEGILGNTAAALTAGGYDLQVPIMEAGVNVFLEGEAGRDRLYREGDAFRLRTSGEVVSVDDVRARCKADPSVLSPNVLLRPVVESVVFPTLAYVGGPGEMAYFAQLRAYFEAHDVEMPVIFPRWAATPVETKIGKVLKKFDLELSALDRPFHEVASEFARDQMPADVQAAIGQLRGALGKGVEELQEAATAVDPTLKGPVQTMRNQAFTALDGVEKKVTQAVKRKSEITLTQMEKAQLHLFPNGKPAERVQSPMYYLTRYGDDFVRMLYDAFEVNFE